MNTLLKTKNLTKNYSNDKGAINIDMEINENEIVGFIGPNGAGKTTTMKMLNHLIKPDFGEIHLLGKEIKTEIDYLSVSQNIGFLPSEGGLYEYLTAKQLLNYAAQLYGINPKEAEDKISTLAYSFKLDLNTQIKKLSLGNKRKVGIIQSIIHKPKLLILDEPTSGLDPLIQKQVLDLIKEVKQNGGAVLLSSHNLAEVESVCDRIIMIKNARIIFSGKTNEILKKSLKRFRIENVSSKFYEKLKNLKSIKKLDYIGDDITAFVEDPKEVLDYLSAEKFYSFYLEKSTLEESFIEAY